MTHWTTVATPSIFGPSFLTSLHSCSRLYLHGILVKPVECSQAAVELHLVPHLRTNHVTQSQTDASCGRSSSCESATQTFIVPIQETPM